MTWIFPERERVPSPHRYYRRRALGFPESVTSTLLILHYAVDGDQSADDDLDYNFIPRERQHDCMDVARSFQRPSRKASTHFVAGRDGSKVQCVPLDDGCWGAGDGGLSRFPDEIPSLLHSVPFRSRYVNLISTQIELCNVGYDVEKFRIPKEERITATHHAMNKPREWEMFTDYQYRTLELIVAMLRMAQPTLRWVCGHEDVTNRHTMAKKYGGKFDPGPAFEWHRIDWERYGFSRVQYDFETRSFLLVTEQDTKPIEVT
jgi:N-acetyl-anhydromuramyl-L-alanine amidase AmpD